MINLTKVLPAIVVSMFLIGCGPSLEDAKKLGFSSVEEMKKIQASGFKTMKEFNEAEAKRLGFSDPDEMFQLQARGFKTKAEFQEAESKAQRLGFASIEEMQDLQAKGFDTKKDYEQHVFEEEVKNGSFLDFAMGKKWSIGPLPCDINGGAYQVYDQQKGYRFTAGGKETVNQARSEFEYIDLGGRSFKLIQNFYSNDFVERMLRERNVISARMEWTFERLSIDTMSISKRNTNLNFDLLLKGVRRYEVTTETSNVNKLCPNQ